jgi:RNA polymerase sigma-70 factor (ECF subfamily)
MTTYEGLSLALPAIQEVRSELDLTALVESYSALLFRVAHSILRSQSDSEDVVQDVFVRVLEHRRELPDVRDMRVWLVRITWNLALDRKRRIRPDQIDEAFAASLISRNIPADQAIAEAHKMQTVLREIDCLPSVERSVLLLSAIEELGTPEIAGILKKSESSIRSLLFRARAHLRQRIEKGTRA